MRRSLWTKFPVYNKTGPVFKSGRAGLKRRVGELRSPFTGRRPVPPEPSHEKAKVQRRAQLAFHRPEACAWSFYISEPNYFTCLAPGEHSCP